MRFKKILIVDPRPLLREGLKSALGLSDYSIKFSDAGNDYEFLVATGHCRDFDLILIHESFLLIGTYGLITAYLYKTNKPIVVIRDEASEELDITLKFFNISEVIESNQSLDTIAYKMRDLLTRKSQPDWFSCQRKPNLGSINIANNSAKQASANGSSITKDKLEHLTGRQRDVLDYLKVGLMNKEIAYEMGIRESTVKRHVSDIFKKLKVQTRTQLVVSLNH